MLAQQDSSFTRNRILLASILSLFSLGLLWWSTAGVSESDNKLAEATIALSGSAAASHATEESDVSTLERDRADDKHVWADADEEEWDDEEWDEEEWGEVPLQPPTKRPTAMPTRYPTHKKPTAEYPTLRPTAKATIYPTKMQTNKPTIYPTQIPTKQPTGSPLKPAKPYVILYAHGRSGTSTITETLIQSTDMSYCWDATQRIFAKEIFKVLTTSSAELQRCGKEATAKGVLMHVKPMHIMRRPFDVHLNQELTSVTSFFNAAKQAGATLVVHSFRDNILAKHVSAFELVSHNRKFKRGTDVWLALALEKAKVFNSDYIKLVAKEYIDGVQAARASGIATYYVPFLGMRDRLCVYVNRIATHLTPNTSTSINTAYTPADCEVSIEHTKSSARSRPLESRIGALAAAMIKSALHGTVYAWMLDLSATEWPANVPLAYQIDRSERYHPGYP